MSTVSACGSTLPIADAPVEEKRGEIYVNVGKYLSPTLRIDAASITNSRTSRCAAMRCRPDAQVPEAQSDVDWKPGGDWHTRVSIRRTVAQLDFYDFISVGDLSAQRVTGQRRTSSRSAAGSFALTAEHPLLGEDCSSSISGTISSHASGPDPDLRPAHPKGAMSLFDAPGKLGTGKRISRL